LTFIIRFFDSDQQNNYSLRKYQTLIVNTLIGGSIKKSPCRLIHLRFNPIRIVLANIDPTPTKLSL